MATSHRKKRIPQLSYTENRGTGYYVSYRDPETDQPRKHRFGKIPRSQAIEQYQNWLAAHLKGETTPPIKRGPKKLVEQIGQKQKHETVNADIILGSLLQVCSNFLIYELSRIRAADGPRTQNTISQKQFNTRKQFAQEFMQFLNTRYGAGTVGRMKLAELAMEDIEGFNKMLVDSDFSDSQVRKRMQCIKSIIDRAGRPENGRQLLPWNWNSRDAYHGRPDKPIALPTLKQLKLVLRECDNQRTAMVWLGIGCGFGQRDLAAIRVGDIDGTSYDLRRPKTGIDRYGDTPKLVWNVVRQYLTSVPRSDGELMFLTQRGQPLVHNDSDSVEQWWTRLRDSLGDVGAGLNGFYALRHLGATEFGSRPGCSIGDMRRWLGHSVSSSVADRYMRPVSPQTRAVVDWVRKCLQTGKADLR